MNTKKILIPSLAVALVAAIASIIIANLKTEPVVEPAQSSPPAASPAPVVVESAPAAEMPAAETTPKAQPQTAVVQAKTSQKKLPAQTAPSPETEQSLTINGYVVQDTTARAALSFVGADPEAEAYWVDAINNPDLSAQERQDLIEDLNEDGLSDPRNPGPEDLPLIVNRLQLIEELAPYAIDQVNADAFAEAHKDLVTMLDGQPMR